MVECCDTFFVCCILRTWGSGHLGNYILNQNVSQDKLVRCHQMNIFLEFLLLWMCFAKNSRYICVMRKKTNLCVHRLNMAASESYFFRVLNEDGMVR
jgi:hypothetical protein